MTLSHDQAYHVFSNKNTDFDGRVFMGVKTTGIFCRPGCPARLPLQKNCLFFESAQSAIEAKLRACKRCHPARFPGEGGPLVKAMIAKVEAQPEHKWGEADIAALGLDPSTVRRQFQSRFNMSFCAYARGRRLALAARNISKGETVIETQIMAGYESASGFRAAFGKTFGTSPKIASKTARPPLLIDWLDSPMGPILVICDDHSLYMLEFTDRKSMDRQMQALAKRTGRVILPGRTVVTDQIETELTAYFAGHLKHFKTPLELSGTEFQKQTWRALISIPYGETRSYKDLATLVGNPKGFRAVANANGRNGLAIIIPCHRVIGSDGGLGGYAGGLGRKQKLLELERNNIAT